MCYFLSTVVIIEQKCFDLQNRNYPLSRRKKRLKMLTGKLKSLTEQLFSQKTGVEFNTPLTAKYTKFEITRIPTYQFPKILSWSCFQDENI